MLTRLRVVNFQNVLMMDMELGRLNVFTGRSGNGKTARAIRSLFLLALNRPSNDNYLHNPRKANNREWLPGPTTVTAWTDDGHEVSRCRYSNDHVRSLHKAGWVKQIPKIEDQNSYILDGVELTGFDKGVPESVTKALNLSYLNFQHQHHRRIEDPRYSICNPLYLLSMSPGEVAKALNDLAGLNDIDATYNFINKLKYDEQAALRASKESRDDKEAELRRYDNLDQFEVSVEMLTDKEKELTEASASFDLFGRLVDDLRSAEALAGRYRKVKDLKRAVDVLEAKGQQLADAKDELSKLTICLNDLRLAEGRSSKFSMLTILKEALAELEDKGAKLERAKVELTELASTVKSVKDAETEHTKAKSAHDKAKAKWEANRPETCPFGECLLKG